VEGSHAWAVQVGGRIQGNTMGCKIWLCSLCDGALLVSWRAPGPCQQDDGGVSTDQDGTCVPLCRSAILTAAQCATYDEVKRGVLATTGW
jgi:hypothetical protein